MQEHAEHYLHKIYTRILSQMNAMTANHFCAIYGCTDNERGVLLGSGTFISCGEAQYLLTAAHVPFYGESFRPFSHSTVYGKKPVQITNPFMCYTEPSDLAIARIESDVFTTLPHKPVNILSFDTDFNGIDDDILFIHGWPGERSRFVEMLNAGVSSSSLPFATRTGNSSFPWFDPKKHFAIEYSRSHELRDERGNPTWLPDSHGLSGSLVWRCNTQKQGENWVSRDASPVGVITNVDEAAESLVGTRIDVVREFLRHALVQESAYFNWLARGKSDKDSLSDWLAAEQKINNLFKNT